MSAGGGGGGAQYSLVNYTVRGYILWGNLLLLKLREAVSTQPVSTQGLPRVVHQVLLAKYTLQGWVYTHSKIA